MSEDEQKAAAVTYGDVFQIRGKVGERVIRGEEAAAMQSQENSTFGYVEKGGLASAMQSATSKNRNLEREGERAAQVGIVSNVREDGSVSHTAVVEGEVVAERVEQNPSPDMGVHKYAPPGSHLHMEA